MPEYGEIRVDYITYTTGTSPNEGQGTVTVSGLINNPTFSGNVIIANDLTVSGKGIFASGTESTPSITFIDDLNTGIYSPAENEVAISTGGTGRLFIDDSGNVGIGTSSPQGLLDVKKDNATGEGATIAIRNTGSGAGTSVGLYLAPNNAAAVARAAAIKSRQTLSGNYADLGFFTSDGDTPAERMTIASNGNVGIGTSSPIRKMHVVGSNNILLLESDNTTASRIEFQNTASISNDSVSIGSVSNDMQFVTSGSERMRIDSSGNVGIGTSDPDELLHIEGDVAEFKGTNTNPILDTGGTEQVFKFGIEGQKNNIYGPSGSIIFRQDGSSWSVVAANQKPTRIEFCTQDSSTSDTSETPRMVIKQDGNVGIGTSSPATKLDVEGATTITASSTSALFIRDNNVDSNGLKLFSDSAGLSQIDGGYGQLALLTAATERARIDSAGRLLVGTSSARTTIDVFTNNVSPHFQLEGTNSTTAHALITRAADNQFGGYFSFAKTRGATIGGSDPVVSNDSLGTVRWLGDDGTDFEIAAQIEAFVDGTPGTNDMPGRLVFSTTADGASNPTEAVRIDSAQKTYVGSSAISLAASFQTSAALRIATPGSGTGNSAMESNTGTTATRYHITFSNPTVIVGSISTSGSATSYNTSSDYRIKENVVPMTGAADRVKALKPSRFNFIADPDTTVDGFLAHEAQTVVPECVTGTKDEVDDEGNPVYQGIDQSKLVPLLTAALQEALAKIEALEQRLADAGL